MKRPGHQSVKKTSLVDSISCKFLTPAQTQPSVLLLPFSGRLSCSLKVLKFNKPNLQKKSIQTDLLTRQSFAFSASLPKGLSRVHWRPQLEIKKQVHKILKIAKQNLKPECFALNTGYFEKGPAAFNCCSVVSGWSICLVYKKPLAHPGNSECLLLFGFKDKQTKFILSYFPNSC